MVFYVGLVSIAKKMYIFPSYLVTELCNTVVAIKRLEALCSLNLLQNMSYIKHNTTFTNDSLISYTRKFYDLNVNFLKKNIFVSCMCCTAIDLDMD
jgi:hypothetical protein